MKVKPSFFALHRRVGPGNSAIVLYSCTHSSQDRELEQLPNFCIWIGSHLCNTQKMKQVTLITDGACVGNPGPGGWAFILRYKDHAVEFAGSNRDTTNNRMEITAVLEGLKTLKEPCEVLLISDSQYLLNGLASWRFGWRKRGWMRKPKKGEEQPVLNADLWKELDTLADQHKITGKWVRGHSGHPDNERCDELAEAQARHFVDEPCWTGIVAGNK